MAGVYIHIPFCKQACSYCDFHFSTNERDKELLVDALVKEIQLRAADWKEEIINTIYFGGGTPSRLSLDEVEAILQAVKQQYSLGNEVEVTFELNPEDATKEYLEGLKNLGVNRLSVGIQSFNQDILGWMKRAHTAEESSKCLDMVSSLFGNYSVDLIYGLPGTSAAYWEDTLKQIMKWNPPHLSCYNLTVENKTLLEKWVEEAKIEAPTDELGSRDFEILTQFLKAKGYDHYEISNARLPDMESKHNRAYWKGVSYLGVGLSAHSFVGNERRWTVASNAAYIQKIKKGESFWEVEELTAKDQFNEAIMLGLRAKWGVDVEKLKNTTGHNLLILHNAKLEKYISEKYLVLQKNNLQMTEKGKLFADQISADLFLVE